MSSWCLSFRPFSWHSSVALWLLPVFCLDCRIKKYQIILLVEFSRTSDWSALKKYIKISKDQRSAALQHHLHASRRYHLHLAELHDFVWKYAIPFHAVSSLPFLQCWPIPRALLCCGSSNTCNVGKAMIRHLCKMKTASQQQGNPQSTSTNRV